MLFTVHGCGRRCVSGEEKLWVTAMESDVDALYEVHGGGVVAVFEGVEPVVEFEKSVFAGNSEEVWGGQIYDGLGHGLGRHGVGGERGGEGRVLRKYGAAEFVTFSGLDMDEAF